MAKRISNLEGLGGQARTLNVDAKQIRVAREFLSTFDVKLRYGRTIRVSYADLNTDTIYFACDCLKDFENFWSTLFHELAHILCKRQRLYNTYHTYRNNIHTRKFKAVALKAERFVENYASDLAKIYYPELQYRYTYYFNRSKRWLYKYYGWDCG